MRSRYDFMLEGVSTDIDNLTYPDPLSVSYVSGTLTKSPEVHMITDTDLQKFWKYFYDTYQKIELDDIYLNINGIPYLGMLEPGSLVLNPEYNDLEKYILEKPIGEEIT